MRKAILTILVAAGALWGFANTAEAFHRKVRTTCIAYYPGLYSYASCGCGYSPYVYSCAYRYPKFCGRHKACWRGSLSCASQYPYGCGSGGCGSCGSSCASYGDCGDGGCGSCGGGSCGYSSCGSCGNGGCGGSCGDGGCGMGGCSDGGCGVGGCGDGGCAGGSSAGMSFETDSKTIYDGPAPGPEPATTPPPAADGDPMASTRQIGFRLASSTRQNGTPAYASGLRAYWDGNMNEALRAFDAASAAEPQNALYQYYRALAFYNLQGAEAANQWLAQAVQMEHEAPIKNWGTQMERVQGRARLWVEQARSAAVSR